MILQVHTGPTFTVHLDDVPEGWAVWVERHWPQGTDQTRHMLEVYSEPNLTQAECYAMALSEAHGDCAVVLA